MSSKLPVARFVVFPLRGSWLPDAVPVSAAVIVPAVKFPEASRSTIVDATFVEP